MQWVLLLVIAAVGMLILLVIIGMLLPRDHVAASRIGLQQSPETVWSLVRDLGKVPAFWTDIKSSERQPDQEGRQVWLQRMKNGFALPLIIEEDLPPKKLVTRIAVTGKAPFGGRWIYQIAEAPGGSELTITEDGWIDNPFFRVISRLMGYHGTVDRYLRALTRHLGESGEPEHV